jgi:hypothetical protein
MYSCESIGVEHFGKFLQPDQTIEPLAASRNAYLVFDSTHRVPINGGGDIPDGSVKLYFRKNVLVWLLSLGVLSFLANDGLDFGYVAKFFGFGGNDENTQQPK